MTINNTDNDISKITRRLVFSNFAVFFIVLNVFSCSVYYFWDQHIHEQERLQLSRLADSVIASIDFEGNEDSGKPDLLVSDMPEEESRSLSQLRLQFFDTNGKLTAERGHLKITQPFVATNQFETQTEPHALILTKPVSLKGRLIGFTRVASPLAKTDATMRYLLMGLGLGMFIALIFAAAGTIWLVLLALKPIQNQIKQLEKFTSDAAHELRSPIAVVRTNSEVALKYLDDKDAKDLEKFQVILDAAKQMQRLTEDLLLLARGQQKVKPTTLPNENSVISIINEAILPLTETSNNALNENQVKFVVTLSQTEPDSTKSALAVRGDRYDLIRVIRNIAENAARYSQSDGVVDIGVESSSDSISVVIKDYGIGIDKHDLQHIFDRFWRADQARNHHFQGNGLGLSIASTLAKRNQASISVTSEKNEGTAFTVTMRKALP